MDVFDLYAKIGLDKSEYESGLNDAKGSMSNLAKSVGDGLKTVAKIGATAIAAGAAGVAALTKMSVEGYAEYEQLVGGVETLFKESAGTIQDYADRAYMTAGLSANAYMETITSFSASLIQSLGGDTAKAAEIGDMAITDMSDNANKMGTSMEMIQNAYNGFAKQNYTMLDNLKLGYGGTKEEMQRLIDDANKVKEANGEMADLSIDSFADVAEAIHIIQTEMGITGTTSREAASTISGSIGMMKGAWQNLVTALAGDGWDIGVYIENFVDSVVTVGENIIPRIKIIFNGIGQLVAGLAPIIAEALPGMVESVLPPLLEAAVDLVSSIAGALPGLLSSLLPVVIQSAIDVVMAFIGCITENAGLLLQTGVDALLQIVTGISEALPQLIESAITIVMELVGTLTSPDNLQLLLDAAILFITVIVNGLIDNLPKLIEAALLLVENLVSFITNPDNIEKLLNMASELLLKITNGLIDAIPQLIEAALEIIKSLISFILVPENLRKIIDMTISLIKTVTNGLIDAIPQLVDAAFEIIVQLIAFITAPENIIMLVNMALDLVLAIVEGLLKAIPELVNGATKLIEKLCEEFSDTDWAKVGSDIIDGVLDGLKSAWESVKSWFSNAWDSLFNKKAKVDVDGEGNVKVGGYATGLNYVPYDNFPAFLHRGEAVLTAAQARTWRNGQAQPAMAGGVTINQYIQSVPQTPVEFANATEAYFEQARWAL